MHTTALPSEARLLGHARLTAAVCIALQGLAGGLMLCISFVDLLPQSMQVLLEVQ